MNAGSFHLLQESRGAVEDAMPDDQVRVLVFTGAGRRFHAGDDVKEVCLAQDREKRRSETKLARIKGTRGQSGLPEVFKPTIAAT